VSTPPIASQEDRAMFIIRCEMAVATHLRLPRPTESHAMFAVEKRLEEVNQLVSQFHDYEWPELYSVRLQLIGCLSHPGRS
jgi:hypothetical protein